MKLFNQTKLLGSCKTPLRYSTTRHKAIDNILRFGYYVASFLSHLSVSTHRSYLILVKYTLSPGLNLYLRAILVKSIMCVNISVIRTNGHWWYPYLLTPDGSYISSFTFVFAYKGAHDVRVAFAKETTKDHQYQLGKSTNPYTAVITIQ